MEKIEKDVFDETFSDREIDLTDNLIGLFVKRKDLETEKELTRY